MKNIAVTPGAIKRINESKSGYSKTIAFTVTLNIQNADWSAWGSIYYCYKDVTNLGITGTIVGATVTYMNVNGTSGSAWCAINKIDNNSLQIITMRPNNTATVTGKVMVVIYIE